MTKTILILAANPKNTSQLRLDLEVRKIDDGLQRAKKRDRFMLKQKWAVRPVDVRRAMLDYKPNIVHFCGHGGGEDGLVFEDESENTRLVDAETLAEFFELFADVVDCVVLNACFSETQAEAIAQHINYVIGMNSSIGDAAAIEFSVAFYDAIGTGESVEFAHKLACNAIRWSGAPEHLIPTLKSRRYCIESAKPKNIGAKSAQKPYVFVAYSRVDGQTVAEHLCDELQSHGIDTWYDTKHLDPYVDFSWEIEQVIEKSTHVIVCITPDVRCSDSFVRREISFALVMGKPILPLMFPEGLCPITIINHTSIDFQNWDIGFSALLEQLKGDDEEKLIPKTRCEKQLVYLQAIGQRFDHWRDLYVDMPCRSIRTIKGKVPVKRGSAACYLDMQHHIFKTISHELDNADIETEIAEDFGELCNVIKEKRRVALVGAPGAGKTTTLQRLAYELGVDTLSYYP